MLFEPTRSAGIARLADFVPRAGRAYSNSRNYDDGAPGDGSARSNVSQLSPWLHSGLLSEREVIEAVLTRHSPSAAEKFIAEVFWRIYFKGYLEQRPTVWRTYCDTRDAALARLESNAGLRKAYTQAIQGRTGIAAFDHWARELTTTGYLHNHARMWFASIWIFTLKLDWSLGADFFLRHLIDGDAASNTLSWRWVGGLHTKGKTYLARPDNIAQYTQNQPGGPLEAHGLALDAPALEEETEHTRAKLDLPGPLAADTFGEPYALILHDEAANHEPLGLPLNLPRPPSLVLYVDRASARSPGDVAPAVMSFAQEATASGAGEAGAAFNCPVERWDECAELPQILNQAGIERAVVPYLPVGWTRDALMPEIAPMIDAGRVSVSLGELNRATWPHAKAGFFGVKKQIDRILRELGIPDPAAQGELALG
ncbi:MAG: FAD-binding domain-containing protein [Pseudomonadota bacterium]